MKIAFDTNMIVRLIAQDDPVKLKKVTHLIVKYNEKDIFVCCIVLIEAFHVLTKFYNIPKEKVMESFEDLLRFEQFTFEHETALRQAIIKSRKSFEFNDTLIGEIAAAKSVKTMTFDKGLQGNLSFTVIS